eukprot:COSAG01_NODE_18091_length_1101_cov_2.598802_2_plen_84_part_01
MLSQWALTVGGAEVAEGPARQTAAAAVGDCTQVGERRPKQGKQQEETKEKRAAACAGLLCLACRQPLQIDTGAGGDNGIMAPPN